jgi:hypothetical protein
MFGIAVKSLGIWAFAFSSGSKTFSFQDERLQGALGFYEEGQQLLQDGSYRDACDAMMTGIFSGRKVVEAMCASDADDPETIEALDWLIVSYISCCEARMKLGDWQTARGDAWAACMFSQNLNPQALHCMLKVCENTNDLIGELNTLKSIQPLVLANDGGPESSESELSLKTVKHRIEEVEELLEKEFKK